MWVVFARLAFVRPSASMTTAFSRWLMVLALAGMAGCRDAAAPIVAPIRHDTLPPVITLQPVDSILGGTTVTIAGVAEDDGVVTRLLVQRINLDGQCCAESPTEMNITPAARVAFSGTYSVYPGDFAFVFTAIDSAGNKRVASVKVILDRTPPELYVIAPWSVATDSAVIAVNGRASPETSLTLSYAIGDGPSIAMGTISGRPEPYPISPKRNEFSAALSVPVASDSTNVTVILTDRANNSVSRRVVIRRGTPVASVSGSDHWCYLTDVGQAWCWGANQYGQLGTGDLNPRTAPVRVAGGLTFTQLSVANWKTCGIASDGQAYCWGLQEIAPGYINPKSTPLPTLVPGAIHFQKIAAGWLHNCGVTADGSAYCWGWNFAGELGDGTTVPNYVPQRVGGTVLFDFVSPGDFHTCGLARDGAAYCWGRNSNYEGGFGTNVPAHILTPTRTAPGLSFRTIEANNDHTCGMATDGYAYCWGDDDQARLGLGDAWELVFIPSPMRVVISEPLRSFSAVYFHGCAIGISGVTYCWGTVGLGTIFRDPFAGFESVPIRAAYGIPLVSVSPGVYGTCGLTATGALYCWGAGDFYGGTPAIGP